MKPHEILKALDRWHNGIPDDLLNDAVDQQEDITPGLIAALEEVAQKPDTFLQDPERNLFYWGAYLLAHFEEPKALLPMVNLLKLDGGKYAPLVEDFFEDAPLLLANVSGENKEPIIELARGAFTEQLRETAVDTLGLLCAWGAIDPVIVEREYKSILESLRPENAWLGAVLTNAAMDLGMRDLGVTIRAAYDRNAVDRDLADIDLFAEWLIETDFEAPPPFVHLRQSIDDIVEFFHEKMREDLMLDGADEDLPPEGVELN